MRPVESYVPETEDWLVVEHGDGMAEMPGRDDFLEIRRRSDFDHCGSLMERLTANQTGGIPARVTGAAGHSPGKRRHACPRDSLHQECRFQRLSPHPG